MRLQSHLLKTTSSQSYSQLEYTPVIALLSPKHYIDAIMITYITCPSVRSLSLLNRPNLIRVVVGTQPRLDCSPLVVSVFDIHTLTFACNRDPAVGGEVKCLSGELIVALPDLRGKGYEDV